MNKALLASIAFLGFVAFSAPVQAQIWISPALGCQCGGQQPQWRPQQRRMMVMPQRRIIMPQQQIIVQRQENIGARFILGILSGLMVHGRHHAIAEQAPQESPQPEIGWVYTPNAD